MTQESYIPPFTLTDDITHLISEISEQLGILNTRLGDKMPSPMLRKKNQIRTIHSSLAIENNTLSVKQMTDIIEGKRVLGAPDEIQEVKNAIEAYRLMPQLDAFKEKDLLKAHGLMMKELVRNAGNYRNEGVGVFDGNGNCIHMAPPPSQIPRLMGDLFKWVKKCKSHPLVYSCVFHYEFEFIHPFLDGNGRMGRYWQTMLLSRWKGVFAWLPVETIVKEHQQEYYAAIAQSDREASSTTFIEFMLKCILDAVVNYEDSDSEMQNKVQNKVQNKIRGEYPEIPSSAWEVFEIIRNNPYATGNTICANLGLKERQVYKHISVLKSQGLIVREGSNKTGYWKILKSEL
ncbi:MAG: Fic family protein [Prevotella sp.]|nr:Fic family protein [Prevotella sp.]